MYLSFTLDWIRWWHSPTIGVWMCYERLLLTSCCCCSSFWLQKCQQNWHQMQLAKTPKVSTQEMMKCIHLQIQHTGVWLHESGVIGASPDGIVTHQPHCSGHTGILHFQTEAAKYLEAELIEVKCPYSAKDMKIKDAVKTVPGFFLETADGYLHLKEDSDYYNQIQGQLYITKKKCCD